AWIGHPMELKEKVIEQVLAGTFDVKKAAAEYEQQQRNEGQLRALTTEFGRAMMTKKWDEATAKLSELEKLLPEDARSGLDDARMAILFGKKDYPAAYKLAAQLSDANKDNPGFLNNLAWQIATDESIEQRDLELAEKCALRAYEAEKGKNANTLDTVARVFFLRGKKAEAVEFEEKAAKLSAGKQKDEFQKVLDSYKKGELPKD
ncbi:MAG: hypothetical protein HY300_09315, partial [Verrucomicrobia bacterium]|nr:hypothetical protein [Verrucomicrobiota bacterium]